MVKPDPLVAALDALTAPPPDIGRYLRDRPDIANAVLAALDREVTAAEITATLAAAGFVTTDDSIRKWARNARTRRG